MKKRIFIITIVSILLISIIGGCGNSNSGSSSGSTGKNYQIALIPQLLGNTYFETSNAWAQEAGRDLGVEVIYTGSSTFDPALQVGVVQDMITKGVDCICIAAADADALAPVMKQARQAGILVITWDSDTNDLEARDKYVTYCIDQELGEDLMIELAKYMNEEGEYAIITSMLTVQNNALWSKYATEYQEAHYPNMQRVAYEPCDDDQSKAYTITQNLMTAYPNLKGILGVTTPAPPASSQAIREAGKSGEIVVVGIVEPSTSREFLKDGSMHESIMWHPGKLGYLTIYTAKVLLDGGDIKDGEDIPKVGKVKVVNGNVIMDELLHITKDNVDDYDF